MSVWTPFSMRRIWTLTKVWAALRDVPEVGVLALLGGGALAMGGYTLIRSYTPANESFPSKEVRKDPELQAMYGAAYNTPSFYARVAQRWGSDDKGYKIGIFENRARPFEYNLPTQTTAHSSARCETSVPVADSP